MSFTKTAKRVTFSTELFIVKWMLISELILALRSVSAIIFNKRKLSACVHPFIYYFSDNGIEWGYWDKEMAYLVYIERD